MNLLINLIFLIGLPASGLNSSDYCYQSDGVQKATDHIELTINNIKNKKGLIQIGIFTSEVGYPDNPTIDYSFAKDTLTSTTLRVEIPVPKPGKYSISILDDENENEKMDYRFGILPKEGFGFSNNPKILSMRAPSFSATAITFTGGVMKVIVNMVYL